MPYARLLRGFQAGMGGRKSFEFAVPRRQGQPPRVVALADKAQSRLHRRMYALTLRGKHLNKATVAVARELVGFIWAALREPTTSAA
jgi:hypothetical protein